MIYLLIATESTPGGSSTINIYKHTHTHTHNTQNNTMKQNTQNRTYVTIRIHKHNNKNTQLTKLNNLWGREPWQRAAVRSAWQTVRSWNRRFHSSQRQDLCLLHCMMTGSGTHPPSYSVVLLSWSESQDGLQVPRSYCYPPVKPSGLNLKNPQIIHLTTEWSQNKKYSTLSHTIITRRASGLPGNINRQTIFLLPETLPTGEAKLVKLPGPGGPEGCPVPDHAAYVFSLSAVSVGCTN